MIDLHRHDEYSVFDGFGKPSELVKTAKKKGYTMLSITNHGTVSGWVQHYKACKQEEMGCILGAEVYFKPVFTETRRPYHLCLYAKNFTGYKNINKILTEAENNKYYQATVTFDILEKYSDGVICSTACVGSYTSQCIASDNTPLALKSLQKLKEIFKQDLYVEIQPYALHGTDGMGLQEKVNITLIKLAKQLKIKCILTSDSHYGDKSDFDTYLILNEIAGKDLAHTTDTYKDRYMPNIDDLYYRFIELHQGDFKDVTTLSREMCNNTDELGSKIEQNILDNLVLKMPKVDKVEKGKTSKDTIIEAVITGLKKRGKYKDNYIKRCKEEIKVILTLGYEDYFLIVSDYVKFAKENKIAVGGGRGSCCNSLVCYALYITEVDSLLYNLEFRRFLREDRKKLPDIDLDFETFRRDEVIEYLTNKYPTQSAKVCNYGFYRVDNLVNDLAKVCNVDDKSTISEIKGWIKTELMDEEQTTVKSLEQITSDKGLYYQYEAYNKYYNNIIKHFLKLNLKLRYIGSNASGVAITSGNIIDYTALRKDKNGNMFTYYDLADLNDINVIKFDILGLRTMSVISELRTLTGNTEFDDKHVNDKKLLQAFTNGETTGVFQFGTRTPTKLCEEIHVDSFMDAVAITSINRPASLKNKMHKQYKSNKEDAEAWKDTMYSRYTKDSHGCIIFQEQVMHICVNIGGLTWNEADIVIKLGNNAKSSSAWEKNVKNYEELNTKFLAGALNYGMTRTQAQELFDSITEYAFNKGHAVGYTLISFEEMYYKVYHPLEYWYTKIKYVQKEEEVRKLTEKAVFGGCVVFLAHVNYSQVDTHLRNVKEEGKCIQEGLRSVKGVGDLASKEIMKERMKNGIFTSYDNFYDRCYGRVTNKRVVNALLESGALEFNHSIYIQRVTQYNRHLYGRGMK